ncbi:alpha/beta hydrolase [Thalassotalea sp. PLHSN55]|uniref:alpha/beta hydrolase n=1 Tax=Thalassotalea sp. PLHSN55 TaxID=3435888 RepID=UPI003F8526D0
MPVVKCLLIFLCAIAFTSYGQQWRDNCVEVNSNSQLIEQSINDGLFRFSDTNKATPTFSFDESKSYAQYLQYGRALIAATNVQASRPCPINSPIASYLNNQSSEPTFTVADLISPFELLQTNNQKAILLIHGLTDSPFVFHDLSAFYYQQGFNVRTLLLPGHGGTASNLVDTKLSHWQQAVKFAIEKTSADFEQVYLGGYSAGGALIFDYLLNQKSELSNIAGLFMWGPAIAAKSEQAWLAPYLAKVPFLTWFDESADIDFAKYESFPVNAAAQVEQLMTSVRESDLNNFRHNIPLFIVATEVDQTINSQATLHFANQWHQPARSPKTSADRYIHYGDRAVAKQTLANSINLHFPLCNKGEQHVCNQVIDVAHLALTNSPTNGHYGQNGSYRNCEHYLAEINQYQACKSQHDIVAGEKSAENLSQYPLVKRLTYNPYYFDMLEQIKLFLHQTAAEFN